MKKIFIVSVIVFATSTVSFANDKELSNKEYINTLNNYVGEMKSETDVKEGNLISSVLGGFDDEYLSKDINRLRLLKDGCDSLVDNMKEVKLLDKTLQHKHNNLMSRYENVSERLTKVINEKENLLNSSSYSIVKFGKTILIDSTKTHLANEEIDKLNDEYKSINEYYKQSSF